MDNKALYKLSYGIFMIGSRAGGRKNGCITNTCIQAANSPTRVACCIINTNYTCDLIKESGVFTVSVLDQSVTFETIKHFGFQSGRDVDKLADMQLPEDEFGTPYLDWQANAMLSCKVMESHDLGSHTLFIAEVVDARVLSDLPPVTYADYQDHIKPKPKKAEETAEKKIVGWRCRICNYYYEGAELPDDFACPLCGHGPEDFEPVYA